jgi:Holliday junction resolvase RusA-like endonuclease
MTLPTTTTPASPLGAGETGTAGNVGKEVAPCCLTPPAVPVLSFVVHGIPKPKGSLRHVGHGRLKEQVDNAPWRDSIIWATVTAMPSPDPILGPVRVDATFTFPKPASAPKTRMSWPTTRTSGDLDKHCRLLLDALQAAGAIRDDAQVTELHAAKRFVGEGAGALGFPGCVVRLYSVLPLDTP